VSEHEKIKNKAKKKKNKKKDVSNDENFDLEEADRMLKELEDDEEQEDDENARETDSSDYKKCTIIAKNIRIEVTDVEKSRSNFTATEPNSGYASMPQNNMGNYGYSNGFSYNNGVQPPNMDYKPEEGGFNITPSYGGGAPNYGTGQSWNGMPPPNYGMNYYAPNNMNNNMMNNMPQDPNSYGAGNVPNMPQGVGYPAGSPGIPQQYWNNGMSMNTYSTSETPSLNAGNGSEVNNHSESEAEKPLMTLEEYRAEQKRAEEAREKQRKQKIRIVGSREHINASALDGGVFVAGNKVYKWGDTKVLEH